MQHHTNHVRWAALPVALRVVGVVAFCAAALTFLMFHAAPRATASGLSAMITGTISSSPSTGPVGTTISVSGSGWGGTDGTPVTFGYEVNSGGNTVCQIVSDAQNGSLNGGSFSGWFRWPTGTALNTFSVCAMLGNVMEVADSFSVLSSSPPAVSISPSTLAPGTQATITASNYYPAGTQVDFLWVIGNTVIENLNSATSDTNGQAILTFTVPKPSISSGQYTVNATTGGQPPALFSSTNFTYTAPTVSPSPTPTHRPSPTVTATPGVTPTTTPTVTPTAAASVTATGATPTAGASPTVGNSQTPTTNGTHTGNNNGTNTGTPTSGSSHNLLLIGGVAVLGGALLAGIVLLLLLMRRRKAARPVAKVIPPRVPGSPGQMPWVNPQNPPGFPVQNGAIPSPFNTNNGLPGNPLYPPYAQVAGAGVFAPQPGSKLALPITPAPMPVGAGVAGNGNAPAPAANPGAMPPMFQNSPQPLQPPTWLTSPPSYGNGSVPTAGWNTPPNMPISADPALDAMRRQAQSGLFVSPRPFKDERSQ